MDAASAFHRGALSTGVPIAGGREVRVQPGGSPCSRSASCTSSAVRPPPGMRTQLAPPGLNPSTKSLKTRTLPSVCRLKTNACAWSGPGASNGAIAPASSVSSTSLGSPCLDPTSTTLGLTSGTPNAAGATVLCAHLYPNRSNSLTRSHMMGTPSPSLSSSAEDASMSTHGVRGLDFISRSTCFSLDATESLLQLSRQDPSSSAETTDAARRSVSAGKTSTTPASRGWQIP